MGRYGIVTLHNIIKNPWNPCRNKGWNAGTPHPQRSRNAGIPRSLTGDANHSKIMGKKNSVIDIQQLHSFHNCSEGTSFMSKLVMFLTEKISRNLGINMLQNPCQNAEWEEKLIVFPSQMFIALQITKINTTLPNNSTNLSSNQPPPDPATAAGLVVYLIQSLNSHRPSPTWLKEPRPLVKLT